VASILELDENLNSNYQTFEAAAQVRPRSLHFTKKLTAGRD